MPHASQALRHNPLLPSASRTEASGGASRTALMARGVHGYQNQQAALSYDRSKSCQKAMQAESRNEWVREHGGLLSSTPAMQRAPMLQQIRQMTCRADSGVPDATAANLAASASAAVAPGERLYDSSQADARTENDGYIAGAKAVKVAADVAGGVTDACFNTVLPGSGYLTGMARKTLGDWSEAEHEGDGYQGADLLESAGEFGLEALLGMGIKGLLPTNLITSAATSLAPRIGMEATPEMLTDGIKALVTAPIKKGVHALAE